MSDKISRRKFLKSTAGIALTASLSPAIDNIMSNANAEEELDLAVVKSEKPESSVKAAIEALGGIGKFVKSGDIVVIKPNMAFPNPPEWGSTTNPEVVYAVAKLCLDADARSILILDHPMGRPEQCLKRSGIADACQKLGSGKIRVSMEMEQRDYKEVKLEKAKTLEKTEIHKVMLRTDTFINIPVAKSHSATGVSFGMKNVMGLIWDRISLHKTDLHQNIADLNSFERFKPSLVLVDGTRALTTKGPEGPGRTFSLNTIVAGIDPVAVDSYAVKLSLWNGRRYDPQDVKHIAAARDMNLGEMDLSKINIEEINL